MSIIEQLKDLIGYSGSDLDQLFAILAFIIVVWFMFTFFNIFSAIFKGFRRW